MKKILLASVLIVCVIPLTCEAGLWRWVKAVVTGNDEVQAGSTYRDRDGNKHSASQTLTQRGGYWYGQDGRVITGE